MTSENRAWEGVGPKVDVRRSIYMFKLLQALQRLDIKCEYTMWGLVYHSKPPQIATHLKVDKAIVDALVEKLEKGRPGSKEVSVKVEMY
jgi:hypothetical protein